MASETVVPWRLAGADENWQRRAEQGEPDGAAPGYEERKRVHAA